MRNLIKIVLCGCMLCGCKSQPEQKAGFFRQPNWLERRIERLETWNLRHGYPIEKSRDAMLCTLAVTGVVTATVAGIVAYCMLNSSEQHSKYKTPFTDDLGYPLPN